MGNTAKVIKATFEDLIDRLNRAEKRIIDQEDKSIQMTQTETMRKQSREKQQKQHQRSI